MRTVLAVVVAAALISTAVPALEPVRVDRTAADLRAEFDDVETAARRLATSDAVPSSLPGARRSVVLDVPPNSYARVGVAFVRIGCESKPCHRPFAFRLVGHDPVRFGAPGLTVTTPDGPVVLRGDGPHRLRLSLVDSGDGPAVSVSSEGRA